MNSTKKRIILKAIDNFNKNGVGNVRVHDIAKAMEISPGNLTYHFKTKSDLMYAVHDYMMAALTESMAGKEQFEGVEDIVFVTSAYMKFQVQHRFFYRDFLEIIRLCPDLQASYKIVINGVLKFNTTILKLAISKGFIVEEQHEGHYTILIKNHWAVLHSWLTQREVLGDKAISITDGMKSIFILYFPYLTTEGKQFYAAMIEEVVKVETEEV